MCGCDTSALLKAINASQLQNFAQIANNDKDLQKKLVAWTKNPNPLTLAAVNAKLEVLKARFLADLPSKADASKFSVFVNLSTPTCNQVFATKGSNVPLIKAFSKKVATNLDTSSPIQNSTIGSANAGMVTTQVPLR